jgi:uncharacterized protein (TIGR02266 family)
VPLPRPSPALVKPAAPLADIRGDRIQEGRRMAKGRGGIERRKLKRTVTRVPASFESGTLRGTCHIKNVSKGGLFLRSDVLPPRGSEVRVLFHTREGRKVEVNGTVAWNTDDLPEETDARRGFGIRFLELSDGYLEFYEQILVY